VNEMNMWKTIMEAQSKKQDKIKVIEEGQETQIRIIQNGWYEEFESVS
jgi:hypothetical protein